MFWHVSLYMWLWVSTVLGFFLTAASAFSVNSSLSCAAVTSFLLDPAANTGTKKKRKKKENWEKNEMMNVSIYSAATFFERLLIKSEKRHHFTVWAFVFPQDTSAYQAEPRQRIWTLNGTKQSLHKLVHEGIIPFSLSFWGQLRTDVALTHFLVDSSFKQVQTFSSREPQRQLWHVY